jgi:membrane protein YqaA with SNARE-associated domain
MKISRQTVLRVLSLLAVIAISAWIYSIKDQAAQFAKYGYPGIFFIAMLASATVFLPAPGVAVVFAMGSLFTPWLVALFAGSGAAVGEMVGYLAGYSGQGLAEKTDVFWKVEPYVKKYGVVAIFTFSAIPNPFFDIAGVAAGLLKMPPLKFFIACWLGEVLKMFLFAYAGSVSINWFQQFIH